MDTTPPPRSQTTMSSAAVSPRHRLDRVGLGDRLADVGAERQRPPFQQRCVAWAGNSEATVRRTRWMHLTQLEGAHLPPHLHPCTGIGEGGRERVAAAPSAVHAGRPQAGIEHRGGKLGEPDLALRREAGDERRVIAGHHHERRRTAGPVIDQHGQRPPSIGIAGESAQQPERQLALAARCVQRLAQLLQRPADVGHGPYRHRGSIPGRTGDSHTSPWG